MRFSAQAFLDSNEDQQKVDLSFSEPRRTNYIELDPQGTGPIAQSELEVVPQRYEFYQFIDGQVKAHYTVDDTGEFTVIENADYEVAQKLGAFPTDGSHATTWPYYEFWIPSDGSIIYALDAASEDFLGAPSVDSDTYRALDAAKALASEAEYKQILAEEAERERTLGVPAYFVVVLLVVSVGLGVLFYPRSGRFRPKHD
jgi:hypothetical protein